MIHFKFSNNSQTDPFLNFTKYIILDAFQLNFLTSEQKITHPLLESLITISYGKTGPKSSNLDT